MRKVTTRTQTIRENITLMPENFGGWYAQNIGTGNVEVDGFVVKPGEHLDFLSLGACVWNSPIAIVCQSGGILRLSRLKYTEEG